MAPTQSYKSRFIPIIVEVLRACPQHRGQGSAIIEQVIRQAQVTPSERRARTASGDPQIRKQILQSKRYLLDSHCLTCPKRNLWELTERGATLSLTEASIRALRREVDLYWRTQKTRGAASPTPRLRQNHDPSPHGNSARVLGDLEMETSMGEKIITVTPAVAAEFLRKNFKNNRNMRQHDIDRMALEMSSGAWRADVMGTFAFHQDGTLRDGQHRCAAIVKSQTTWQVRVLYNLTDEDCRVLDLGRTRTYPDTLKLDGVEQSGKLGPAIRFLWNYEHNYRQGGRAERNPGIPAQNAVREKSPGLEESLPYGNRCWKYLSPSVGSGLHYLFRQVNRDRADAFFTSIADGDGLSKGNPVLRLREAIHSRLKQVKRIFPAEQTHLVIQAWNAYMTNRKAGVLTYHVGEPTPPIVRGHE